MSFDSVRFGELFAEPQKNGLTRPKKVRGSGFPMVNMGELFAYPRIQNILMDLVPVEEKESHYFLEPGDLLFARQSLVLSGAGQCSIFLGNAVPTVFESHLIRCRLNKQYCNPLFYFYFFRSPEGRTVIEAIVEQGAGASGIRGSDLINIQVPKPPKNFQDSAALILSTLDDRIALLHETNTTLEAIAQALFKSWFVDFDPVHANAGTQAPSLPAEMQALFPSRLVESPQGLIPEGWMVGCIGDVVSVKGGYAFKSADFQDSGLPVIKIKNIVGDGTVDVSDVQKVSETIASKAQRFALQSGDILMAMTGATIGKVGVFVSENEELAYLNQRVAKFENKSLDQKNTWLAFIAFSNAFMAEQIVNAASGSAQPNISAAGIESTRLVVPSDKLVLSSFNDLVEPLFTGWINNQKTIRTLANLRDTLLPRLISGQLRLPEAEAALVKVK